MQIYTELSLHMSSTIRKNNKNQIFIAVGLQTFHITVLKPNSRRNYIFISQNCRGVVRLVIQLLSGTLSEITSGIKPQTYFCLFGRLLKIPTRRDVDRFTGSCAPALYAPASKHFWYRGTACAVFTTAIYWSLPSHRLKHLPKGMDIDFWNLSLT